MIRRIRGEMFDKQLAVQDDPARFRAAHPGRRGGKSESMYRGCAIDALQAGPGETVVLAAETQKKARALHWQPFYSMCSRLGLPFTPKVQEGAFVTPWHSRVVFWGIQDDSAVELLRGFKMVSFKGDEAATFSAKIPYLVTAVLEPALGDTNGTCTLYGTPTVTRVSAWADICLGVTPGWSVHHWTVLSNPMFPRDAASMLQQVRLRNQWGEDDATYQREYMGKFVNDQSMVVYSFEPTRNSATSLPVSLERGEVTMGVDYGTTNDPTAWVVLWSQRGSREVYVLEARKRHGLLPDDAAVITKELVDRWQPTRIVGDGGGLGAPYVRAYNRRYSTPTTFVQPADKLGLLGQITLTAQEMKAGRIRLLPAAADLATELAVLPWKDSKRVLQHPDYPNDLCDAMRYAFVSHHTYHIADAAPAQSPEEAALRERQRKARLQARARVV